MKVNTLTNYTDILIFNFTHIIYPQRWVHNVTSKLSFEDF